MFLDVIAKCRVDGMANASSVRPMETAILFEGGAVDVRGGRWGARLLIFGSGVMAAML
jgi:hypothetical protein